MAYSDFEYAGKNLSDFGFVVCNFGSKGLETKVNGGQSTFNTVSTLNGKKFELVNVEYEDCASNVIQICKTPCFGDVMEISSIELNNLTRWLCRNNFYKLKILDGHYLDLYFEARFKVSKIELDGILVGLELEIETNAPYAFKDPQIITINNTKVDGEHAINDMSQEEGFIYPHTEITVKGNGNLDIYNALENRHTFIRNCKDGEVITMNYPIISSTLESHKIQNDFNWNFFRIANTYEKSRNDLKISLPCTIKLKYSPVVKVGL